jgi:hypothetical protein
MLLRIGHLPVTVSPQKASGFHRRLASGDLAMVPLWPQPCVVTTPHAHAECAPLAWAGQRPGHGPSKVSLGQGDPVPVGCSEDRVNSDVFLFLWINSNQVQFNFEFSSNSRNFSINFRI